MNPCTEPSRGTSPADLAARIGAELGCVRRLLEEDVERGVVEFDDAGTYRLTHEAEHRYGPALRLLASLRGDE